jgi:hypothetical protein
MQVIYLMFHLTSELGSILTRVLELGKMSRLEFPGNSRNHALPALPALGILEVPVTLSLPVYAVSLVHVLALVSPVHLMYLVIRRVDQGKLYWLSRNTFCLLSDLALGGPILAKLLAVAYNNARGIIYYTLEYFCGLSSMFRSWFP